MLTYNILMLTCDLFMSTCKMLTRKIIQVACKNSYLAQWHHYVPFDLAIKPRLTRRIKAYGVVLQTGIGNTTEWWRSVQTSLFLFYFLLLFYYFILFSRNLSFILQIEMTYIYSLQDNTHIPSTDAVLCE